MPRLARTVIPGLPYHVTHRGNNRQEIFLGESDYQAYLALLMKYAERAALSIKGYCLMPNHSHVVTIPEREDSLAKGIGHAHLRYAQIFNWHHDRCGHLWQGRFYSCLMDEAHLVAALRYVERNPVRAGLVENAWDYPWSSAAAHVGMGDPSGLLDLEEWRSSWTPTAWRSLLVGIEEADDIETIRLNTRTGRPYGSEEFIAQLEKKLGRRLHPLQVGRPRKAKARK